MLSIGGITCMRVFTCWIGIPSRVCQGHGVIIRAVHGFQFRNEWSLLYHTICYLHGQAVHNASHLISIVIRGRISCVSCKYSNMHTHPIIPRGCSTSLVSKINPINTHHHPLFTMAATAASSSSATATNSAGSTSKQPIQGGSTTPTPTAPPKHRELPVKEAAAFKLALKAYESREYKKGLKTCEGILKKCPDHGGMKSSGPGWRWLVVGGPCIPWTSALSLLQASPWRDIILLVEPFELTSM